MLWPSRGHTYLGVLTGRLSMHASAANASSSTRIRITLKTKDVPRRAELRRYVKRRMATSFGRFEHRIRQLTVWLEDVNGPRGGVDTRCRMDIQFRPSGRISVSALAIDEYAATATAADRAREIVDRRVKKVRTRRRQPSRS